MSEANGLNGFGAAADTCDRDGARSSASVYLHPDDVLADPALTRSEKRALLAEWISDRHAVPDHPAKRQLDHGAIVEIDDVLRALRALDEIDAAPSPDGFGRSAPIPFPRRRMARRLGLGAADHDPDDDDPPPGGVSARVPVWISALAA